MDQNAIIGDRAKEKAPKKTGENKLSVKSPLVRKNLGCGIAVPPGQQSTKISAIGARGARSKAKEKTETKGSDLAVGQRAEVHKYCGRRGNNGDAGQMERGKMENQREEGENTAAHSTTAIIGRLYC